jgi:hypothetical protein
MELHHLHQPTILNDSLARLHRENAWNACHTVTAVDPERLWGLQGFRPGPHRPALRRGLADLLLRAAEVLARSDPSGEPV